MKVSLILALTLFFLLLWKFVVEFGGWVFDVPRQQKVLLDSVNSLSNLPHVRFQSQLPFDEASRQNACLASFLYIGPDFVENFNCEQVCKTDGVKARYVQQFEEVYVNRVRLGRGLYCMRSSAANCNASTTIVMFTEQGWNCINRFAEFGGVGGNKILACDGRLRDNLLGRVFEGEIPYNLRFTSVDEKVPGTDKFRFECLRIRDRFDNDMVPVPWSRLEYVENYCTLGSRKSVPIEHNFSRCKCEEMGLLTDQGVCIGCRETDLENVEENAHMFRMIKAGRCEVPEYLFRDRIDSLKRPICTNSNINCYEFEAKFGLDVPYEFYEKYSKLFTGRVSVPHPS